LGENINEKLKKKFSNFNEKLKKKFSSFNEKLKGVVKKDKKIEYSNYENPSCEAIFAS
jgi:hypothetical protein